MLKKTILIVALFVLVPMSIALPYRPDCAYSTTGINGWEVAFNDNGATEICMYDAETLYIKSDLRRSFSTGQLYKTSFADVFIDNVGFLQDKPLKFGQGVKFQFEYYRPYYNDDGVTCPTDSPLLREVLFVSNEANQFFSNLFRTADTRVIGVCDSWQTYSMSINEFANSWGEQFGNSFSANNRGIEGINFEFSNVYIRNVTILNSNGGTYGVWNGN